MRGTKHIISQHISFTVAISTERINCIVCIQLSLQQRLQLLLKTFNICFNNRWTLSLYQSGIESSSFNIDRYLKLTAMTLQCVIDVTAVTSQLAAAAILWSHHFCAARNAISFPETIKTSSSQPHSNLGWHSLEIIRYGMNATMPLWFLCFENKEKTNNTAN